MNTVRACLLVVFLSWTQSPVAQGQTFNVLHSFAGSDGGQPYGGMVLSDSNLYGIAGNSLFRMETNGSNFGVLHTFNSVANEHPASALATNGSTLFGTTCQLGTNGNGTIAVVGGTVYSVGVDGSGYNVVHSFGGTDGSAPTNVSNLVLNGSTLYGTTSGGGIGGFGTVFRVNTDGSSFTVLHSFAGTDGAAPAFLSLVGSTLYGTTFGTPPFGSIINVGNIFSLSADGNDFSILHTFTGSDGSRPMGGLVFDGSKLYGTTQYGGINGGGGSGVIFSLGTDGSAFSILHRCLAANGGGAWPTGTLVPNGSILFGLDEAGGDNGQGSIFQIGTDGSGFEFVHSFNGSDGLYPLGSLTLGNSTLYGTTPSGGNGYGVVFSETVATIPEPSTFALLGVGAASILPFAWRRRARSCESAQTHP